MKGIGETMIISKIIGSGSCLPERVIPNSHFDYLVENADEWIFSRTGIRERRFAHADQATSDLATILHRVEHLGATRMVYVVGIAQKQHFEMVFAAARKIGWVNEDVILEHLGFGNMLAATGKPFARYCCTTAW